MIDHSLRRLMDSIATAGRVSAEDVQELRHVFFGGLACRHEAETLVAVDRLAVPKDPTWLDFFVNALVDFVIRTSEPPGHVDAETTRWLTAALTGGEEPSGMAMRIAFEIVREAEQVDETLLAFALQSMHGRCPQPQDNVLIRVAGHC